MYLFYLQLLCVNGNGRGMDLCCQCVFGFFGQCSKIGCVVYGDVSQNFVVQGDVGFEQVIYEMVVVQVVDVGSCVDVGDLQ